MPAALAEGEVLVTLSCLAPSTLLFPQRRLLLSNQKSSIPIGRASKRSSTLESRMYNAWVDAPVMSRRHAELRFDSQGQKVLIQDVGSLHGTYHNDTKLQQGQAKALYHGDLLKFGIAIDRGNESFPQCTMKVGIEFGRTGDQAAIEASLPQPIVFSVPDETDSEMDDMDEMHEMQFAHDMEDVEDSDIDSQAAFSTPDDNDDDPALRASAMALAENGLELEFRGFDTSDPIDLTSEPDLVSEDNIPSSSPISNDSDLPAHNEDYTLGTVELDDVELGDLSEVSGALPSEGFAPAAQLKEDVTVDIVDENIPGMNGPLSEDQHLSAISEITPSMRAKSLGELSGKPEYFIAREQNKLNLQTLFTSRDEQPELVCGFPKELPAPVSSHSEEPTLAIPKESEIGSKKRKADQISDSSPLELQAQVDDGVLDVSSRASLPQDVPSNAAVTLAYKRVKTAAEYVGIMAIGGAAVMTALIATAPTF
ncbi:hypothetical protein LMH87_000793 [Akanthomyces muscarius]|uniref:FHA domain-containing protein n=1 Tax=Akanthomyces muscarius TaxID=2231603 RepID=A0A9W8UP11_AKAMU|nr:hypothetical protein LMH87_000793 [Akanthomyces muscarius]KAJ4155554.1 hypothetical protein LMH87_000793 [Akanthomyces muscarius]